MGPRNPVNSPGFYIGNVLELIGLASFVLYEHLSVGPVSLVHSSVGRGATQFARENGFPFVESHDLVTDEAVKELEDYRKFNTTIKELFSGKLSLGRAPAHLDISGSMEVRFRSLHCPYRSRHRWGCGD